MSYAHGIFDRLGLIPSGRIMTWASAAAGRVNLATLYGYASIPSAPVLIRVPIDPSDPGHFFTVEYRFRGRGRIGTECSAKAVGAMV